MNNIKIKRMEKALLESWSKKSSSKWTKNNPASGQCGVTSLVVSYILGGKILKTKINGDWHYYNKIDNKIYDFTKSQFSQKIIYDNIISCRSEAFSDTNTRQFNYLYNSVQKYFSRLFK